MGMIFSQENKVAQGLAPVDLNTAAVNTDWISMANYPHVCFIVHIGVHGAATTMTVSNASDSSGTGATNIAFRYRLTATTAVDDFGDVTSVAATGVATDGSTANIMYVIEIDARELTDGMDFVRVQFTDPGASTLAGVAVIGSRGKIKQNTGKSLMS